MCDVCDPLFARHLGSSTENNSNAKQLNTSKQQWFDEECQESRDRFYRELNKYREDKSVLNQRSMISARKSFKKLIRKKKYTFKKLKTDKLIALKFENAKEYWRLLKQTENTNVKHSISSKQFADYFKAINNP